MTLFFSFLSLTSAGLSFFLSFFLSFTVCLSFFHFVSVCFFRCTLSFSRFSILDICWSVFFHCVSVFLSWRFVCFFLSLLQLCFFIFRQSLPPHSSQCWQLSVFASVSNGQRAFLCMPNSSVFPSAAKTWPTSQGVHSFPRTELLERIYFSVSASNSDRDYDRAVKMWSN